MCGILGAVNKHFDESTLTLINHRGPDSLGVKKFEVGTHKVLLGMTRLAIVDLSEAGKQPMMSSCGNYAIIFNGEIYNHMQLREKLLETEFKGHSDTETVLYYLKKFGIDAVKDFNGIFGFSFLDISARKIFLARDIFGVKPLYYLVRGESLVFSSEIRTIKNIENQTLSIDEDNLATLLKLRYLPSPLTLYAQINKIKPGHYISVDLENPHFDIIEKYFVKPQKKQNIPIGYPIVEMYGKYLDEAVKRQLMADVEVGILLSGGIDSAVIAALAQKNSKKKLKAFTIGFEGDYEEDEIEQAEKTAEILGLEHYSKKINFTDFLSIIKETTRIIEEPLATTSSIPMYFLAQMASSHVKVVLTGQGADEPLGGYQKYQGELISQRIPRGLINLSKKIIPYTGIKSEKILRASKSLGEPEDIKRFLNVSSLFSNDEIGRLLKVGNSKASGLIEYFYNLLDLKQKKYSVERMMALDTRMNLADDLLLYTDKISMNFSLECRVPMLDLELVNFIESLPIDQRIKIGKSKIIHKKFAKEILPLEIINRKKMAFQSPTNFWFKKHHKVITELLLGSSAFTNILDEKEVKAIINQHIEGYNREKQIFLMLSVYYWLEYF
ncbi:asparagine synthase (glutamine-hydrolyzing) [Aequorivita lipolytica]|uniref:asparagine synthase (glutamine-hydrolyzing) n=1 Tax=Aequorivita lipolytica TaxID=153267 RepID=A0A5C6YTL9_9FLAO|nr:asparagine synthase (glutamine-hydrolyzing) [Aequorivita lipolytica]TXD70281.1 asparagine synthase (glutamine-hydrolyzing) [Aequorivita lipolytica]SRX50708.1 Asparagine synthetase [glutamine-hydrolyzing] 1 [Aequorivita lipolytica]